MLSQYISRTYEFTNSGDTERAMRMGQEIADGVLREIETKIKSLPSYQRLPNGDVMLSCKDVLQIVHEMQKR